MRENAEAEVHPSLGRHLSIYGRLVYAGDELRRRTSTFPRLMKFGNTWKEYNIDNSGGV